MANRLFFGDNLQMLREYVVDESVDLIYLDPPFNSNASYNVLFKAPTGRAADAQIEAFEDTWHWGPAAEHAFSEVMTSSNGEAAGMLRAMRSFLGENDMMAYLAMMAIRLLELRRVMKPVSSLYLHCDPTASHYLKIIMDGIFGHHRFLSEVVWKRTSAHSSARRFGPIHDTILLYGGREGYKWNPIFQRYDQSYIDEFYTHTDENGRRWRRSDLTGAGTRSGETGLAWRGIEVTSKGRHWAWPPSTLEKLDKKGKIHWPQKPGGIPMLKRYLDEQSGMPLQDVILDIPPMHNLAAERLGYPTQKPLALLERLIGASSDEGDIVLDPFCGCGTAIAAAQALGRRWIGIDITHLAVQVIIERLKGNRTTAAYEVVGRPVDIEGAKELARQDKHQFQYWAVWLAEGVPYGQGKKGMDRGVDGLIFFSLGRSDTGIGIVSVKGGEHIGPAMIRELRGTMERAGAQIGAFVTLANPTREMEREASAAGVYDTGFKTIPRIQIRTIQQLLGGKKLDLPPVLDGPTRLRLARSGTNTKARQAKKEQREMMLPIPGAKAQHAALAETAEAFIHTIGAKGGKRKRV